MVLDLCGRAGFESVVLNRQSDDPHHQALRRNSSYRIVYNGDPSDSRTIEVSLYYYESDADRRAMEFIAAPSVALLTTSVTPDGLPAVAPLIARAVEMRQANTALPLWVIACENLPLNSQKLAEHVGIHLSPATRDAYLRTHVFFSNTVVDRVCTGIAEAAGFVEVEAESYSEWIIEPPPIELAAVRRLSQVPDVKVVRNRAEFEAYETRKYWCLNGVHLAGAAYAYNYDSSIDLFADALMNRDILAKVQALQEDLGFAFRCYSERTGVISLFPEEEVRQYNDMLLLRFLQNRKERVARLLKHEEKIEKTIRDFVESIVEPGIGDIIDSIDKALGEAKEWKEDSGRMLYEDLKRLLRDKLRSILRDKLEKNLRLLDVHQFLDRVAERLLGPQREILSYLERRGESCPRLELDDALQTILMATHKYTRKAYERAIASLREAIAK
jgi:mannitol-1-phosphate/altronate dehydrogenase